MEVGVIVKVLSSDDIDHYISCFSEPVKAFLRVVTNETEREYVLHQLESKLFRETFFYGIWIDQNLVGAIEIRDREIYPGQLYCWLHHDYWGKGYFQKALKQAMEEYFSKTGELYITAYVEKHNKRSYYALKKCGFIDAGIVRSSYELIFVNKR